MYLHSRTASIVFKFAIAVIGTIALLDQIGLFAGEFNPRFFCFFTNISNVAVVAYFWCAGILCVAGRNAHDPWRPKLKYALTLAITVTFLVAHFMLDGGGVFSAGYFRWEMLVVHYLVPIGAIVDWIVFDKKGHMAKKDPLTWPIFPLIYLLYIIVLVEGFGVWATETTRWPYPFINVDMLGIPTVALTVVGLVVFFVLLGYGYYALDRTLAKRIKE